MRIDARRLAAVRRGFEGPASKVRHATKHLGELQRQVERWLKREPYDFTQDLVSDRAWMIARLKVRRKPPEAFGLIVGDLVHDLRSALDHAVYELARLTTDDPVGTQFPIFVRRPDYLRRQGKTTARARYLAGVPSPYRSWIDRLQPFGRPDPTGGRLALLQSLSNTDKHRMIHAVYVTSAADLEIRAENFRTRGFEVQYPPKRIVDDGAELFRFRPFEAALADASVKELAIWTEFRVEVGFGPRAVTLKAITDTWAWVFAIIGTLKGFVEGPSGLPFNIDGTPLVDRSTPWNPEELDE